MNKRQLLRQYQKNQEAVYKRIMANGIDFLAEDNILSILESVTELPYNEVILEGFSEDELYAMVSQYCQSQGPALGFINFPIDDSDIDWSFIDEDKLEKATVQHSGKIWVIHQNDADPHPSSPHAHNYGAGVKLDLYNGNIYRKKQLVGKMKQKEFDSLRAKVKSNFPNITFK